jgi:hypothetical protein
MLRLLGRVMLALSTAGLLATCATPAHPISEEERCIRYGGLWRPGPGMCVTPGSGGGM